MTDELDVINYWKRRALKAEKELKQIDMIMDEYINEIGTICPSVNEIKKITGERQSEINE